MTTFKEFVKPNNAKGSDLSVIQERTQSSLIKSIEINLSSSVLSTHSEKRKLSHELAEIVANDDFINQLSADIGNVIDNESEDEFVSRAQNSLRNLLQRRFSNLG